jgi:hypothetical protein
MSSRNFVSLILLLPFFVATTSFCSAPTVDILYAAENTDLLTYTVAPSTLQATKVGEPLTLAGAPVFNLVVPSPNDHFIYVSTSNTQTFQVTLSVYATDSSGVPQTPAIQTIGPESIYEFAIDPNDKFAYMLQYATNSQDEYFYQMRLFTIDAATGRLTESPQAQVNFPPSSYCGPTFQGFYPNGSQLNYAYVCDYPDSFSATYFYSDVNSQTGELGPAVQIFKFNDNDGGTSADEVLLSPRTLNNLHTVNSQTSIRIYPLEADADNPVINCTSTMLPACSQAGQFWQDIAGQYLVLATNPNFEIVKVELQQKQIVDTGSSVSGQPYFSLDDLMIYGVDYQPGNNSTVQIYGFNPSNGAVTIGEQLTFPATLWNVFPAQRN